MVQDKIMEKNTSGMISIDLMVALVLLIAAVFLAIQIIPALSHESRDLRIKQYMAATRSSDNLVQTKGANSWENEWIANNYSNVSKIGFMYIGPDGALHKVLDERKVRALMGTSYIDNGLSWWEFPNTSTTSSQRDNASRALGLSGYDFYMQLHPVGLDKEKFNSTLIETNIRNHNMDFDKASEVDRYVYIKDPAGEYLHDIDEKTLHYRLNLWVW